MKNICISKYFTIVFILFFSSKNAYGQRLTHVLGEVIIEVKNDASVERLNTELGINTKYKKSLTFRKISSSPMNLWVAKVDFKTVDENTFLRDVTLSKNVLQAQKNHITQLRNQPNDPDFTKQWQYINTGQTGGVIGADIDMDLAWDIATGGVTVDGDTIVVCIIDDGIAAAHPDLGNNLWINHKEIPENGIDDDNNGYVDDYKGWNAYGDNDNVYVGGGHGTPVAGIVGAKGNNGIGVSGVNWDVKLMIVRGGSPEATALASYAYPYQMRKLYNDTNGEKGAFVVSTNASWGVDFGKPEDAPIWCDFYNMLGEVGILNFGATINSNVNVDVDGDLPTACESNYLVSVTNMNTNDQKVGGAGYGYRSIDLGAFGANTYTLTSTGYGGFGGTSGATPHVAGTAALLYSANCNQFMEITKNNPARAALMIKDCILYGVDPNPSIASITTSGGRLNAHKAIMNLMAACGDCTPALGADISDISLESAILTWTNLENVGKVDLRYKLLEDDQWTEINDVKSPYGFLDLLACNAYEYQLKTLCTGSVDSAYTYSRIFKTEGCCDIPSGIDISLLGNSATIKWDDVIAATSFNVEWKLSSSEIWQMVDISDENSFTINNLDDCLSYEVRIKSKCENTNNESEFTTIYSIITPCGNCTLDYCAFSEKNTSDEWIGSVSIENVFENLPMPSDIGYRHFLDDFGIKLRRNSTYSLTLVPAYASSAYDEYFSVYLDWDQNGVFDNADAVFQSIEATRDTLKSTFSVPSTAKNGLTRMRVIMRYNEVSGPCDVGGFQYGDIHDYCVNVSDETWEWAPIGAKWYVNKGFDFNGESPKQLEIIESTQDTLVDGKMCRLVGAFPTYMSDGKVYYYYQNGFHQLYDFTAAVGDTVTFEMINCEDNISELVFTVQDISPVTIENIDIKKYTLNQIFFDIPEHVSYYLNGIYVYYEEVGSTEYPINNNLCQAYIPEYIFPYLRCYISDNLEFHTEKFINAPFYDEGCNAMPSSSTDENEDFGFSIYPNPTDGQLVISFGDAPSRDTEISIIDINGKSVLINPSFFNISEGRLDVSSFADGVYLIQVASDKSIQYKKWIKI